MYFKVAAVLLILGVAISSMALSKCSGKKEQKAKSENAQLKSDYKKLSNSVQYSNEAKEKVNDEQHQAAEKANQAVAQIAAIKKSAPAKPVDGGDSSGTVRSDVPDPRVMQVAAEAREFADRAASRLRGKDAGD